MAAVGFSFPTIDARPSPIFQISACEQKQTQNPKKNMYILKFLCLKTKQNTETSDEEHSDSEFYYPKEQETAEER